MNTIYTYENHTMHTYTDYTGKECIELLINYNHSANIPIEFKTTKDSAILVTRPAGKAILRLPIINATLRKYYNNIKDYYYLPLEDTCIHKSIASMVDKEYRENAKKETCYTKHNGLFIQSLFNSSDNAFKADYNSTNYYIPFANEEITQIINSFGNQLLSYFF